MFNKGISPPNNLKIGKDIDIEIVPVSLFKTNSTIIKDKSTGDAILFDPGAEGNRILEELQALGDFNLVAIAATHAHLDHIAHVGYFKELYPDTPFYLHKNDLFFLTENPFSRFAKRIKAYPCPIPDKFIEEGEVIKIGNLEFNVIHTPGHSPGSVCYYEPNIQVVLTGDTLFKGSVGRTDLIFGSEEDLKKSILKLLQLPDETTVIPGHFNLSTIGEERNHNTFIKRMKNRNSSHCTLHDSF